MSELLKLFNVASPGCQSKHLSWTPSEVSFSKQQWHTRACLIPCLTKDMRTYLPKLSAGYGQIIQSTFPLLYMHKPGLEHTSEARVSTVGRYFDRGSLSHPFLADISPIPAHIDIFGLAM
jgi:hypothetical protein